MKAEGVDLDRLIGLQFKRNVYGLSIWTDTIRHIGYKWKLIDRDKRQIEIFIMGSNNDLHFSLDEIVIINKPLHWVEESVLVKREFHEALRNGGDIDEVAKKHNIKFVKPFDIDENSKE